MSKLIPTRLKELRESRGLSQGQLAQMIGVERSAVTMWEGQNPTPARSMQLLLASALNTSTQYLIGETDDPSFRPPPWAGGDEQPIVVTANYDNVVLDAITALEQHFDDTVKKVVKGPIRITQPVVVTDETVKSAVQSAIEDAVKKLKPKKPITISVSDHGKKQDFTYEQLAAQQLQIIRALGESMSQLQGQIIEFKREQAEMKELLLRQQSASISALPDRKPKSA